MSGDVVIYGDDTDVPLLRRAGIDCSVLETDALDGMSEGVAIILGATALTLRSITIVIKTLLERRSRISMAIGGNEYRNVDKETALKIVDQHFARSVPEDNKNRQQ